MDCMEPLKTRRVYNSRGRQEQARRTRDAILDVARKRFLTDGYAATTMPSIAAEVGVSVDTVHKAFGGKAGLVRAIYQRSLDGSGPLAAPRRSDQMQRGETDPHAIVRQWGTLTTEVAPLVAPVHLLIRDAAATDPEMAALLRDSDDQRRERMRNNAHTLADRGHLTPGVTIEDATDVMWTYSSPELFELLVLRCGWDIARYGRFLGQAIAAALLPQVPRRTDVDGVPPAGHVTQAGSAITDPAHSVL
jgi:AcrR family transcriptional regulator